QKVTVKEQQEWQIPPCASNWKNAKDYKISLDKCLAADGRGLWTVNITENFAKLAKVLNIAEWKVHEAVEMDAQVAKDGSKKKEKYDGKLKKMAPKAREKRAGSRPMWKKKIV
ncbi:Hypothetical predicted protein, partial [Marmota monax]